MTRIVLRWTIFVGNLIAATTMLAYFRKRHVGLGTRARSGRSSTPRTSARPAIGRAGGPPGRPTSGDRGLGADALQDGGDDTIATLAAERVDTVDRHVERRLELTAEQVPGAV